MLAAPADEAAALMAAAWEEQRWQAEQDRQQDQEWQKRRDEYRKQRRR